MPNDIQNDMILKTSVEKFRENVKGREEYAAFLQSISDLEAYFTPLHEMDELGRRPLLNGEQRRELMRLAVEVGKASEQVQKLPEQLDGNLDMVRKLTNMAMGVHQTLAKYNPDARPRSLSSLMEESRTLTVDTRGAAVKDRSVAGAVNRRQPLTFLDNKGKEIVGVFTPAHTMNVWSDLSAELNRIADQIPNQQGKEMIRGLMENYWRKGTGGRPRTSEQMKPYCLADLMSAAAPGVNDKPTPAKLTELLGTIYADRLQGRKVKNYVPKKALQKVCDTLWERRPDITANLHHAIIPDNSRIDNRNAAMSTVADLLGVPNLIARSRPMTLIGKDGAAVNGTFMAEAKGMDSRNLDRDALSINHNSLVGETEAQKETIGGALKSLAELQVLDYICGNVDRHGGNILYQFDADKKLRGVQGIDNDCAFGLYAKLDGSGRKEMVGPSNMMVISERMERKVMDLTPETLKFALRGYGLNEDELFAAGKRLEILQNKLVESKQFDFQSLDRDGKLAVGGGNIRVIKDDEWKRLNFDGLSKYGKTNRPANLFANANQSVSTMSNMYRLQRKAYESLRSEIAIGADSRALFSTQAKEKQRVDRLDDLVKRRTTQGRSSPEYDAMQKAVEDYRKFQDGLVERVRQAKKLAKGFDPDDPQLLLDQGLLPDEEKKDMKLRAMIDGEERELSPDDVMDAVITSGDLLEQQRLCKELVRTSQAYLEHKGGGGGLHWSYASKRIDIAKQVQALGAQGAALKPAELDAAEANERTALEEANRRFGNLAERVGVENLKNWPEQPEAEQPEAEQPAMNLI